LPIKQSLILSNQTKTTSKNGGENLPLVIVNPKSAAGSTESRWAQIASDLRAHFGAFQVAFTKKAGDGADLAKRGAAGGRKFIIACGGDGTINEVANGILESGKDIELGVLPSGTGGDFRRTLNMPKEAREAAKGLREGATKTIDVGKVTFFNHQNEQISRYFLNVSSFGLSAAINERVKAKNSFGWLPFDAIRGKAKFAFSTLQEFFDSEFTTVRVKIDDREEKSLNTINFCVANSRYFGGGMKIAPDAKLDDGFLDVVNIGDIKTAKILLNAYKLYNGSHLELEEVKSTLARRIEVSAANANQTIFIETDGELPGKLPAIYEIVPRALKVRVPKTI
jgi:YegS/Rv2252/BmrU family lipid kinase